MSHPTRDHQHTHTHTNLGLIKRLLHPEEVCVGSFKRGQSLHLNTTLNSGGPLCLPPPLLLLDHSFLPFTFSGLLPTFFSPSLSGVRGQVLSSGEVQIFCFSHGAINLQSSRLRSLVRIHLFKKLHFSRQLVPPPVHFLHLD